MKLTKLYESVIKETEMLFMEDVTQETCDCCKYFDFTYSQAGGYFGGLTNPLYYELEKGERNEQKYIAPKQYIYAIARGFGGLSYDDVTKSGSVSMTNVKKYAEAMKNGEKFPIGWYKDGSGGQEGRHRALAAMELGCETIPVVVISEVSHDEAREIATKYKDLPRETLDRIYKDKGYNGITDLDWRTIRRWVEYKL